MRSILTRLLILFFFCFSVQNGNAMIIPGSSSPDPSISIVWKKIASMKMKDFQKLTGHKLSFKEKLGFFILKQKAKHFVKKGMPEEGSGSLGKTAMYIGIAGIALFLLAFLVAPLIFASLVAGILAVVLGSSAYKKDSSDRHASTAKLLGWITIGLFALLLLLAVVLISTWSWGWE